MDFKSIMKQPDLGKRIVELRKAKGLTQEELVEKCNLNVRTLQRIEAGEVTPRSYTIRTIFEALDLNLLDASDSALTESDTNRIRQSTWLEQFYSYSIDLFNLRTNTMKKISILTVVTCVLGFGLVAIFSESQAQSTAKVKKAIEASNKNFVRWYNDGKIDSLISIYRDDACLLGKGCGKEVVRLYFQSQLQTGFKFKELTTSELRVDKSVAIEKGQFLLTLQSGQEISGEYITEWKLTDKQWRIASDMATTSNSETPNLKE